MAQVAQGRVGGRAYDDDGEVPALVREDDRGVAVERAEPGDRRAHRAAVGAAAQPVGPVDVGDAGVAADQGRGPVEPPRPAGRVDDQVGFHQRAVDAGADDPAGPLDQTVHVTLHDLQPRGRGGRAPQRALEGHPAGERPARHRAGRGVERPRLGAGGQPAVVRGRPARAEHVGDLGAEAVRMGELHDAAPFPRAAPGRTGVAVHGHHLVPAGGQPGAGEQPGRPGADDENAHDHSIGYTGSRLVTSKVTSIVEVSRGDREAVPGLPVAAA